jgi:hypothetical protein
MMPLSQGAGPFPEMLVGAGFYKLGYVTTDRDRAIAELRERYGFTEWVPFDPALEVAVADGTVAEARLRCAFSAGRDLVVEVMEAVDGQVDLFRLPPGDFRIAFHHIGVLVDDFDAALETATKAGATPVWSADVPNGMRVSYLDVPLLGHHLELVYYGGDSGAFLEKVRSS